MRLGIFGGSFDPPHVGHLLVAIDAADQLSLDRLYFVPAATQPLKAVRAWASKMQRLEMVAALTKADSRFEADPVEIEREGLSYSVDTVADFARRFPSAELYFLIGADVVQTLPHWREPERIAELARVVVLRRSGEERRGEDRGVGGRDDRRTGPAGVGAGGAVGAGALDTAAAGLAMIRGEATLVATRRIDVSSTEIRERVKEGRTIRGFVPDGVADYIESRGLYR